MKKTPLLVSTLATVAVACGKPTGNSESVSGVSPSIDSQKEQSQNNLLARAESRPEVRAPEAIEASFRSAQREELTALQAQNSRENTGLVIQKDALNKEFLLQTAIIPQDAAALGSGLKSRIVSFRQHSASVFVMLATDPYSITDALPQNMILAELPIVLETGDAITVDFAKGMSRILQASDWYGSDFPGEGQEGWTSIDVRTSFLLDAEAKDEGTFVLRQIAQLDQLSFEAKGSGSALARSNPTIELKYYLKPYRPNPNFKPTVGGDFTQFGYFEAAPRMTENDETEIFATKFDPTKPITFAVSANTPEEYKQAVRDGVLYWNKAFGKKVLQVVDAPEGVTAPDFDYNVIQWVQNDNAGFAYADAQSDPRTGEILHAQAFMTSVFAVSGKKRAELVVKQLEDSAQSDTPKTQRLSLRGFESGLRCARNLAGSWRSALQTLIEQDAPDDMFLRASQDYVAEVVAHEVGHTLGLRHNFAGSLATNLAPSQRQKAFATYLHTGLTPSLEEISQDQETTASAESTDTKAMTPIISSSSVMEYSVFLESVLAGNQMRPEHTAPALPYDLAAIQNLYFGKTFSKEETPLFCTDSLNGVRIDCEVFDVGRNAAEIASWHFEEGRRGFVNSVYEALSQAEGDDADREQTLRAAVLDLSPRALSDRLTQGTNYLTRLLSVDLALHTVRADESQINELTLPGIVEEEQLELLELLKPEVWSEYRTPFTENTIQDLIRTAVDRALAREDITSAEVTALQPELELLKTKILQSAIASDIAAMNASAAGTKFKDGVFNAEIETSLNTKAETYLFARSGYTKTVLPTGHEVQLNSYVASPMLRLQAAKLLSADLGENPDFAAWNELNRQAALESVSARISEMREALGDSSLATMPRAFREELVTDEAIQCELTQGGCSLN